MKKTSMIKIRGANSHPIIDDEVFSMKNRICVMKDSNALFQKVAIVEILQRLKNGNIAFIRNKDSDVNSSLSGPCKKSYQLSLGNEIRCCEPDALLCAFNSTDKVIIKIPSH